MVISDCQQYLPEGTASVFICFPCLVKNLQWDHLKAKRLIVIYVYQPIWVIISICSKKKHLPAFALKSPSFAGKSTSTYQHYGLWDWEEANQSNGIHRRLLPPWKELESCWVPSQWSGTTRVEGSSMRCACTQCTTVHNSALFQWWQLKNSLWGISATELPYLFSATKGRVHKTFQHDPWWELNPLQMRSRSPQNRELDEPGPGRRWWTCGFEWIWSI